MIKRYTSLLFTAICCASMEWATASYRFGSVDYPGAAVSAVFDVNSGGTAVRYYNLVPANSPAGDHGFGFENGNYRTLDPPNSTSSRLAGVNNSGDMVGSYFDANNVEHGFRRTGGTFTTIDFPGSTFSAAIVISDNGHICGGYADSNGKVHGYTLIGGNFTTLDFPGVTTYTAAIKINNAGQVAGEYGGSNGVNHGFLYSGFLRPSMSREQPTPPRLGSTMREWLRACIGTGTVRSTPSFSTEAYLPLSMFPPQRVRTGWASLRLA